MSQTSGPPELPPDSPGSSVSSRLQVGGSVYDTSLDILSYRNTSHITVSQHVINKKKNFYFFCFLSHSERI